MTTGQRRGILIAKWGKKNAIADVADMGGSWAMNKKRILNQIVRGGLFILVLSLGTLAALVAGESTGFALADLSGASVQAMATAAHGDVIYTSLVGGPQPSGIYRSTDNGRTWQIVSPGPGTAARVLAVNPADQSVLYAGTGSGSAALTNSLWFSDNAGQTWRQFAIGLPVSPDGLVPGVTALAVDQNQPNVLYVGTDGHGVYRFSVEPGDVGYELVGGISLITAHVNGLVVGPDSQVYALTNDGLFVTDGRTWQSINPPEKSVVSLAVAPDDPKQLYAGTASTGLYRSTDGGKTWERAEQGLYMIPGVPLRITAVTVDQQDPYRVVAAASYGVGSRIANEGLYESQDAGHTWRRLAGIESLVTQLTANQDVVYAATDGGLVRYGQPGWLGTARSLAHPSGIQILVLALTALLAVLVLIGRLEWVASRRTHAA
jgi:photosystem II stability/assembly factor-like uncharacterized protein